MSGEAGETRASGLSRVSTAQLALATGVLIVLGLAIAVYPTVSFVREFVVGALQPVGRFDANEPYAFTDPDPYAQYSLAIEVDGRDQALPEMDVRLDTDQGPAQTKPLDRWSALMGREYAHFLRIAPPPEGVLDIEITTEGNEDFVLFREINDVYTRALGRALPLWVVALVPVVLGLAALVLMIARLAHSSSEVRLRVD